jgi:hypothetical protein
MMENFLWRGIMWGKNKKTVFFNFLPYECEAAEEFLEAMAEKGWLLQSASGPLLKFNKVEPQKIKYTVDVLHKISELDHGDSEIALEYREYCQKAGWKYVCQKGKILIFYTEDYENTIPIHTDGSEKLKSVIKASLTNVASQLFTTLLLIANIYMQLFMGSVDYFLTSNLGIFSALAVASIIVINTIEIISFFVWVLRARAHLKYNKFMAYNNSKQVRTKNIFKIIYIIIILFVLLLSTPLTNQVFEFPSISLIMAVIVLITCVIFILLRNFINKKRYSKNTNLALYTLYFVLSTYLLMSFAGVAVLRDVTNTEDSMALTEKVPLTLENFGYSSNTNAYQFLKMDKSILANRIDYSCSSGGYDLTYTIFRSQYPLIVKFNQNREISRLSKYSFDLTEIKSKLPKNIKVYANSKYNYFVLVSEDKVVNIKKSFNEIDDEKFLDIVYSKIFTN